MIDVDCRQHLVPDCNPRGHDQAGGQAPPGVQSGHTIDGTGRHIVSFQHIGLKQKGAIFRNAFAEVARTAQ
ncbi:hypothetical protein SDC9_197743 [bioreactor metagenome]|uniref:Uncharacterized protein n=1 Tax=bioreactor metagenome TaxID=1076179 RepID=A0A645IFQ5_9ZZZZ